MKKYWALLAFSVALLCVYLSIDGKIFLPTGYHWETKPTICIAAVLGIPSGLFLLFCVLRFIISSAIRSAYNVTFLSVLWLGIIVIVLMCLYPPWVNIVRLPSSNIKGTNPQGYAFLWHPPEAGFRSGIAIDRTRLLLQILVVVLITGGLLSTIISVVLKKSHIESETDGSRKNGK